MLVIRVGKGAGLSIRKIEDTSGARGELTPLGECKVENGVVKSPDPHAEGYSAMFLPVYPPRAAQNGIVTYKCRIKSSGFVMISQISRLPMIS